MEKENSKVINIVAIVIAVLACIALITVIIVTIFGDGDSEKPYKKGVDKKALAELKGDYEIIGDKPYMKLTINDNRFSCFDVEAGSPGVNGKLYTVDSKYIVVEVNMNYFEEMPHDDWKLDEKNRLVMEYEITDEGIDLTNSGITVRLVMC